MNLYAYGNANPLVFVDPNGKSIATPEDNSIQEVLPDEKVKLRVEFDENETLQGQSEFPKTVVGKLEDLGFESMTEPENSSNDEGLTENNLRDYLQDFDDLVTGNKFSKGIADNLEKRGKALVEGLVVLPESFLRIQGM